MFLTFRMVTGRASAASDRRSAWTGDLCSSLSNFVHDIASKKYVFLLKNSTVHQIRTLMLEGPNFVKFFLFLISKTSLFPRKNDRVLIT